MSERDNLKNKELHWPTCSSTLKLVETKPVLLKCIPTFENLKAAIEPVHGRQPEMVEEAAHSFTTTKVYVIESEGKKNESGIAICPIHHNPVSVLVNY